MITWDVFISHASEDKEVFVTPLAEALQAAGLKVWYDSSSLRVGDSLRESIDTGLRDSRFGVVVISPAFLRKRWPQKELNALIAREATSSTLLLPVWHDLDLEMILRHSPILADRVATSSKRGLACVVADLLSVIRPDSPSSNLTSIDALDDIEQHMLRMLYKAFGLGAFRFTQLAEHIYITERFEWRFDRLLHCGYIDRFLDDETRTRRFRLSPSLDESRLQQLVHPRHHEA
jgi:hypothetical protein